MQHLERIYRTHPSRLELDEKLVLDCLRACFDCAATCTVCADACLGENKVQELVRCIRLNQDCADACNAMGRELARKTAPNWQLLTAMVQSTMVAAAECAKECGKHATMHEHCLICAECCRQCVSACKALFGALPQRS